MTFLLKLLSTQMEFCINLLLKWKHKNIYRLTLISIISFSDNFSWESFYNLKRRFPLSITPLSEHPTLKIQVKDLKHDAHQSSWGDWDAGRTEFGIYISLMKIAKLSLTLSKDWVALFSLVCLFVRPSVRMVTSPFISTVWCSRPYKPYIFWKLIIWWW